MSFRDWLPWNWNWKRWLPGSSQAASASTGGWLSRWTGGGPAGELLLETDLPGVAPEDLSVEVQGDRLIVSALCRCEREWSDSGYSLRQRSWVGVHRVLPLPRDVDPEAFEARLVDGVLRIHGRRLSPEQPARIPVRAS